MLKKIIKNRRGEGYIDYAIGIFCIMLVLAFVIKFLPVFKMKQELDTFANEIVREAEIAGSTSVSGRIASLEQQTGLSPTIQWNCDYFRGNKIQLNDYISVIVSDTYDIGFFNFGSFPITISSKATGKSEVYYK